MTLIFERSEPGRRATAQAPMIRQEAVALPANLRRKQPALLPQASEMQVVRHYTNLSRKNFSIDTQFYPLGSCTMKYNPRGAHKAAMMPGFLGRHPLAPASHSQGFLACMYDLQEVLKEVTGMKGVSLTPAAGAQGEFAGVAMIRAYHLSRNDLARTEMLIPSTAHGTNPATAVMCGYTVREIPVMANGDVDLEALKAAVGPQTAGLMMTNPSTCGVFDQQIDQIALIVHDAGGLLYYDGANLNAILGKVRPGDMGFDVLHMNLHKTFATPHGGGGPGAGPVGVGERLLPFLPTPIVGKEEDGRFRWLDHNDLPQSIGHLHAFMGNAGVLLRAYFYALVLGREGLHRVGEYSTLNANYMMKRLEAAGFQLAYPERRGSHEFIITFAKEAKTLGVSAMDIAKRLLDYGYHAPTTYFPLLVPECFLIEPTETEAPDELDGFIAALVKILEEARTEPELVKGAPHTMPVRRLDDVRAARELDLVYRPVNG
ncbi:MAG: aminomethyl-transferring glycine dehydrogenase subunit GcvPB [Fluviicoccus sp.]|uniref:aminomethyl-transferring glycine dehydrogenase subunit GcvPB n=1 Tax=Fluviicoccus sp. TaxID=2003552 RepID=UPI00271671CE|nr:aminomethyl-transferring glycine dehydrogenase subunit GcvPB [Fluviicoccus sp.]MDO8330331.1 aminomethyl-transferring glycine dehydrogenase subunit GcvPB [Fluviicoccus sp.]